MNITDRAARVVKEWRATEKALRFIKQSNGLSRNIQPDEWTPRLERQVEKELIDLIEMIGRHCDREVARCIDLSTRYTLEGNQANAAHMSAAASMVAKLGREIRALTEPMIDFRAKQEIEIRVKWDEGAPENQITITPKDNE
jgi:hypothetical protein